MQILKKPEDETKGWSHDCRCTHCRVPLRVEFADLFMVPTPFHEYETTPAFMCPECKENNELAKMAQPIYTLRKLIPKTKTEWMKRRGISDD